MPGTEFARRQRSTVKFTLCSLLAVFMGLPSLATFADGTLVPDQRIESAALGYALQYRVYVPEGDDHSALPTIYLTDGQWYLDQGTMVTILDEQIRAGAIEPVVAIFVDSRNPDNLAENRRNSEFMCNHRYIEFFVNELIPAISQSYPVSDDREQRVIAGLSFGGLNAACFALMAHDWFGGAGMQSPASTKHLKVLTRLYKDEERSPVRLFLSVGTKKDNTRAARKFHRVLTDKKYDVDYVEVPHGHEWSNWRPLIDDMLSSFFAARQKKPGSARL